MSVFLCLILIAEANFLTSGSPFMIDTAKVYRSAYNSQVITAVAYAGNNYLAVWQDQRHGYQDIFGARINRQGVVLDTPGIIISACDASKRNPEVASGSTNFLVVWDQYTGTAGIYGARISLDGVLLDSNPIPISNVPGGKFYPAVAFDGTNYFAVWADNRSGNNDIFGARVTPDGIILDPLGLPIAKSLSSENEPYVAFGDSNYFVVWSRPRGDSADIYGARVTCGGTVLDSNGIPISVAPASQGCVHVCSGAGMYLVTWDDKRNGWFDIYGARVLPDGTVLDPQGIPIEIGQGTDEFSRSVFNGTNFFINYESVIGSFHYIQARRMTVDGVLVDTMPITISNNGSQIVYCNAVAFDGLNHFIVWGNRSNYEDDIYGARVRIGGQVIEPNGFLISYSANCQFRPCIDTDSSNYFVVWQDVREDSGDIRGARITPAGSILDPCGFSICPRASNQERPALSFDGRNYLTVWAERGRIYGTRVSPSAVVLDTIGFIISGSTINCYYPPAADYDNRNHFVVWSTWNMSGDTLKGARVSADGVILDPRGIVISASRYHIRYPSLAFDGRNYLVAWSVEEGPSSYTDIYCTRVTPGGVVLDPPTPVSVRRYEYEEMPSVAFGGQDFLIVWGDTRDGCHIYGARVTPSGVVLDTAGFQVSYGTRVESGPRVAFDGCAYFHVVWFDRRNDRGDIYGCRVTNSGIVLDTAGIPILIDSNTQSYPFIAFKNNQYLAVCHGFTTQRYNSYRIFGVLNSQVGVADTTLNDKNIIAFKCYPNPMKNKSMIQFAMSNNSDIILEVFDITGRKVKTLIRGFRKAGTYHLNWKTGSNDGKTLPAGVYFLSLKLGEKQRIIEKIVIVR